MKAIAADGGRVAVSYWGGTVRVLRPDGEVQFEQMFEQDTTALEWLGGRLVVGLANGAMIGLNAAAR